MKLTVTRLALAGLLGTGLLAQAQDDDEVFELSPFAVDASEDVGYRATTTLAGSRVRSNIGDLGASISVLTEEFMQDTGATDGESLLQFVGNVEVGGVLGNFSNAEIDSNNTSESRINPQRGQRVRGLDSAILTRDYFKTDVPFDSYNTSRVTVNRGPNSILFGLGSPGGVINNTTARAYIGSENTDFSFRVGHRGGTRATFDVGRTLVKDRLAVRLAGLREDVRFKQHPAFEEDTRMHLAFDATVFKNENSSFLGRTSIRGSYENGSINRNPPDVVPPTDAYSTWWNGIGSQEDLNRILSVPGVTFENISNQLVTESQVRVAVAAGLATVPDGMSLDEYASFEGQFVPRTTIDRFKRGDPLGNDPTHGGINSAAVIRPYFLFPAINYNSVNATEPGWNSPELAGIQGIMARFRPNGFSTQDVSWTGAFTGGELPGDTLEGAGFTPKSLSNRQVFDYHNLLFSGTTNSIETDFDISQVFIEQELLDGRAGVELAFDTQTIDRVQFTPFDQGDRKSIQLDITEHHAPGDSNFDGIADRLPNENLGRAVVRWNDNTTTTSKNEQDTFRATVFGTFDFADAMSSDIWSSILGKHTLTGLYEDRANEDRSVGIRGSWWADTGKDPGSPHISNGLSDNFRRIVKSQIYTSDDARGLASPDDLRIDGPINVSFPQIGDEYGIWYFDNGPLDTDVRNTWRVIENVQNGNLTRNELISEAWSLQSTFLDGHIVALYAERSDEQSAYERLQSQTAYGLPGTNLSDDPNVPDKSGTRVDLDGLNEIDGSFNLDLLKLQSNPTSVYKDTTSTRSLVVKFPEEYLFELPFGMDLQGHYYEAESFLPGGVSRNIIGDPLSPPFGNTREKGFQVTFLDGKLSLRYNDFTTSSVNSTTNLGGQLGGIVGRFGFYLDRITSAENSGLDLFPSDEDRLLTPDTSPRTNRDRISGTDADIGGFTSYDEYYQAFIDAILPELQNGRNYRVETLESGERVDVSDPFTGLNSTRDFVAKGKEIDVVGQVTRNITLQLNVAQQKTVTSNTGPIAIPLAIAQAERLKQPLPNSPGGWSLWDLRDSPFQVETRDVAFRYSSVLRQMLIEKGKDGTQLAEQREWRVNLSGRYDFLEGPMKGLQVGGSLRYQDRVAGGYPSVYADDGVTALPDIANPFLGPDSIDGDVFFRYSRPIMNDQVNWSVQLNARNIYRSNGDDDIPITFNPDGQVAYTRIPVEQQWFLTNSFSY